MYNAARPSVLYPILDAGLESKDTLAAAISELASAGCRWVQLRAKALTTKDFLDWSCFASRIARKHHIALIINDRADVALLSGADGVHLGQDDLSAAGARRVLGDDAIVGLSTHSVDQARAARDEPVDYIAIGPVFQTDTKADPGEPLGIEGVKAVRAVVDETLVAIGGITMAQASALLDVGVDSLAVISALASIKRGGGGLRAEAERWLALSGLRGNG